MKRQKAPILALTLLTLLNASTALSQNFLGQESNGGFEYQRSANLLETASENILRALEEPKGNIQYFLMHKMGIPQNILKDWDQKKMIEVFSKIEALPNEERSIKDEKGTQQRLALDYCPRKETDTCDPKITVLKPFFDDLLNKNYGFNGDKQDERLLEKTTLSLLFEFSHLLGINGIEKPNQFAAGMYAVLFDRAPSSDLTNGINYGGVYLFDGTGVYLGALFMPADAFLNPEEDGLQSEVEVGSMMDVATDEFKGKIKFIWGPKHVELGGGAIFKLPIGDHESLVGRKYNAGIDLQASGRSNGLVHFRGDASLGFTHFNGKSAMGLLGGVGRESLINNLKGEWDRVSVSRNFGVLQGYISDPKTLIETSCRASAKTNSTADRYDIENQNGEMAQVNHEEKSESDQHFVLCEVNIQRKVDAFGREIIFVVNGQYGNQQDYANFGDTGEFDSHLKMNRSSGSFGIRIPVGGN